LDEEDLKQLDKRFPAPTMKMALDIL
jgi:hypothetical protein